MPRKTVKKKTPPKTKIVPLSNVFKLTVKSIDVLIKNWKIFSIVSVIYFLLSLLFVRGFTSAVNVSQIKSSYVGSGSHAASVIGSDLSAFGNIIGSSFSSSSGSGGFFQTLFFVVFSLIFIWMLREILKDKKITVRESFYNSQYPFIPFIIVLFFLLLELIPMIVGSFLYATVFQNGIAGNSFEEAIWVIIVLIMFALSFYLLINSLFAFFIVTLPNVRPIQALKSSWQLVRGRRLIVLRKVLFLPIGLLIFSSILSILFIAFIPVISDFIFYGISIISLLVAQSYLYALYRELI